MHEVSITRSRHGPFERISARVDVAGRPARVSVYRIGDLLVDAGSTLAAPGLTAALAGEKIRGIVLTHQHEDHAGGVAALRGVLGHVPVHAPAAHVALLRERVVVPPYRERFWGQPEPVSDAIPYTEGAVFEANGVGLEAVLTPGHTPGHMALVAHSRGVTFALTGDLYVGPGPLAAWYESAADDLLRSWRRLARSPFCLLPTHGPVLEDGPRALAEVADQVEAAAEKVIASSTRLQTRDPILVGSDALGPETPFALLSGGEFSNAAFARSVLDPVRTLPATPVRLG